MLLRIIFLAAPWVLAAAHEAPAALLPVLQRIAKVQPQVFTTFVEVVHGLDRLKHDAKGAEKVEKVRRRRPRMMLIFITMTCRHVMQEHWMARLYRHESCSSCCS